MNKRSGIVWLPLLIIVAAVALVATAGYVLTTEGILKNENKNTTANIVVNRTNRNTNAVANANASANTNRTTNVNSAANTNTQPVTRLHPRQEWNWSSEDSVTVFAANEYREIKISTGAQTKFVPEGTVPISFDFGGGVGNPRLVFLVKEGRISILDRQTGEQWSTKLPALLQGEEIYETANILVTSTDGAEAIVIYSRFNKNSEEYRNEFAGPLPVSRRAFRYNIEEDTATQADGYLNVGGFLGPFIEVWDRDTNTVYNNPVGEGVGDASPVIAKDIDTGESVSGIDYGHNATGPTYTPDAVRFVVAESKQPFTPNQPITLHFFNRSDLSTPTASVQLTGIDTSQSAFVNSLDWSPDGSRLALAADKALYLVHPTTGLSTRVFNDDTMNSTYSYWDRNGSIFTQSGRYLLFIDYMNPNGKDGSNEENQSLLKAVDLQNGNTVTTVATFPGHAALVY